MVDTTVGESPDGSGGPHVFVDDVAAPRLAADDRHHLERVLRLRRGEALTVSDGRGRWRACRLGDGVEIAGPVIEVPAPEPALAVGFVPVKGDRPDWVVQKLTELGIDRIVVLRSERSVVRWDGERGERQIERLRVVARNAAMQCRRCHLPTIDGVLALAEVAGPGVVRADRGGSSPALGPELVVVGPEGGWSEAERALVPDAVTVGVHVLRAETAAVAVGTLFAALRGGVVASHLNQRDE
ncbi:MAG: RsmE family RNA methyltransferase [Acidimicrobiales bacterium]